jgi:hypothetical protein
MSELQTMYRAFFHFGGLSMWHTESPAPEFHASAQLSPCGQYVMTQRMRPDKQKHETIREDISEYWQPTKEAALAVVAPGDKHARRGVRVAVMRQRSFRGSIEQTTAVEAGDPCRW